MNKSLKTLYTELICEPLPENKLETPAIRAKLTAFCDTYLEKKSLEKFDKAFCSLIDLTSDFQEQAFSVGFYTAIDLLMRGDR